MPKYSDAQLRAQIRKSLSGSGDSKLEIEGALSAEELQALRKDTARIAAEEMREVARSMLRKARSK